MVTLTLKPKLYPDIIYSLILVISWRTENRTEDNNCRLVSGKSGVGGRGLSVLILILLVSGMCRREELRLPDGAHQPPAATPAPGRGAADQGVILLWIQLRSDLDESQCQ